MTEYVADIGKYTSSVNEAAVAAIVKYCGIALPSTRQERLLSGKKENCS